VPLRVAVCSEIPVAATVVAVGGGGGASPPPPPPHAGSKKKAVNRDNISNPVFRRNFIRYSFVFLASRLKIIKEHLILTIHNWDHPP
jgi:hypothetical protein